MSSIPAGLVVTASVAGMGAIGYFAYRLGLFQQVEVEEKTVGPVVCVYREYKGPYHRVGTIMKQVCALVKENHPPAAQQQQQQRLRCFGMYFDKPGDVPPERCRASLGVMLWGGREAPEKEMKALADSINKEAWAKDNSLKAVVLPASRYAFCVMPYYGMASVILGVWRAYSKLEVACATEQQGRDIKVYGSLEMYDDVEHTMYAGFPLNTRDVLKPFDIGE